MALSITEILNDNTSGSFSLAMNTLKIFSEYLDKEEQTETLIETVFEELHFASKNLIKHQSNMVLLRKSCNTLIAFFKRAQKSEKSKPELFALLQDKIKQIREEYKKNIEIIALSGSKIIANFNKILTYSNSTVVKHIFEKADFQKRKFEVFCLKSDPPGEGTKLAETLNEQGIKTTIVADSQAGIVMNDMNLVVVGADRLYETGFVNKSGTLALCLLAKQFNIPVYLAVETTKILKESERSIKEIERDIKEVYDSSGNISVINSYYEKIPLNLIHKVISEQGVFETPEFSSWYLGD
jgi:translation initiation factor 2B subunit (eIF-2B alpha/beta/delta family)